MFFNLYPLSNTTFINLGRAQFLCDLITGVPIDICAHIFQTIGKTAAQTVARTCLPFCSLLMKIMVLKGVCPPTNGKILACLQPLSVIFFKQVRVTPLKHLRVNFSLTLPLKSLDITSIVQSNLLYFSILDSLLSQNICQYSLT